MLRSFALVLLIRIREVVAGTSDVETKLACTRLQSLFYLITRANPSRCRYALGQEGLAIHACMHFSHHHMNASWDGYLLQDFETHAAVLK